MEIFETVTLILNECIQTCQNCNPDKGQIPQTSTGSSVSIAQKRGAAMTFVFAKHQYVRVRSIDLAPSGGR